MSGVDMCETVGTYEFLSTLSHNVPPVGAGADRDQRHTSD